MIRRRFHRRIYLGILRRQRLICACGCGVKFTRKEGYQFRPRARPGPWRAGHAGQPAGRAGALPQENLSPGYPHGEESRSPAQSLPRPQEAQGPQSARQGLRAVTGVRPDATAENVRAGGGEDLNAARLLQRVRRLLCGLAAQPDRGRAHPRGRRGRARYPGGGGR